MTSGHEHRIKALLRAVERDFRETAALTGISHPDPRIMDALRRIPRERFVPEHGRDMAWENTALSIGYGQTISQPFIVALMTQLLNLDGDSRVLEIGTGSGYQAALLGELAGEVFSVEVVPELAVQARARLQDLGYRNVHVRTGNGRLGWPEEAPFDAVIVTAAADGIPSALVAQLRPGGRMVIPVDRDGYGQDLLLGTREADGALPTHSVLAVAFVPLTGRDDV